MITYCILQIYDFENEDKIDDAKNFIERCKRTKHPSVEEQLKQARLRCEDIEKIYWTSLLNWFYTKNITAKNRDYIKNLFTEALHHDDIFKRSTRSATLFLLTSEEISPLVNTGNFIEVSKMIAKSSLELIPRFQKLGKELKHLVNFKEKLREPNDVTVYFTISYEFRW